MLLEYILSIGEFSSMKFSLLQEQGSIQRILDDDAARDVISGRNGLCTALGYLMNWKLLKFQYCHSN